MQYYYLSINFDQGLPVAGVDFVTAECAETDPKKQIENISISIHSRTFESSIGFLGDWVYSACNRNHICTKINVWTLISVLVETAVGDVRVYVDV